MLILLSNIAHVYCVSIITYICSISIIAHIYDDLICCHRCIPATFNSSDYIMRIINIHLDKKLELNIENDVNVLPTTYLINVCAQN